MVHVGTWGAHARVHEPQTDSPAVDFTGADSRFIAVLDPSQQGTANPIQGARAQCSVCFDCPRLCQCDKLREQYRKKELMRRYPSMRYDVTFHYASTLLQERLDGSNGYNSSITAWCPADPVQVGGSETLTAATLCVDDTGIAVLSDAHLTNDAHLTTVQSPVFPFSVVSSAGFGPLHQCVGRGYDRPSDFVPSRKTATNCLFEDMPLHYQTKTG